MTARQPKHTHCLECRVELISAHVWRAMTREERAEARRAGFHEYDARGLCQGCYARHRHSGELIDWERTTRDADTLLTDWEMLRDDGYTVRQAAERLQVTFAALDKALCRAKRRGDQRGHRRAFGRVA